ncbi:MAG: FAD-dependent oxidoreductase [Chloroflexi bacterium]|nr:FAD-dependent oxidoreductase [Chloroflexota bacterium]
MAEIVIIGGGLTGLSAAYQLERLGVPYTLIEVKARLGGSIRTHRESGFVLDGTHFLLEAPRPRPWLDDLGLGDALIPVDTPDGPRVCFRDGTESLIDALRARLTGTLLTRMAVSSLGPLKPDASDPGPMGVCLENGVLLEARGVIVTAPARYAGHMLYTLAPEPSLYLDAYRYDSIARVSLGFRRADLSQHPHPLTLSLLSEAGATVIFHKTSTLRDTFPLSPLAGKALAWERGAGGEGAESILPTRLPPDHLLIHAAVRLEGDLRTPDDALRHLRSFYPAEPVVTWAHHWPESDPLSRDLPGHAATMDALDVALPPSVLVAGSDYRAVTLDQQVEQGMDVARRLVAQI